MDRLEEMKKKFHILDNWTITMGLDQRLDETPYTGQCSINLDKRIAIIYSWHTNELEPFDYIFHEILHIAIQAVLEDYECRELFVQDLCIQFEEIERLKKEKEWLIDKYAEILWDYTKTGTRAEMKETIINEMQQALKDK